MKALANGEIETLSEIFTSTGDNVSIIAIPIHFLASSKDPYANRIKIVTRLVPNLTNTARTANQFIAP